MAAIPTPTPPPSPYQVFIPAVGAPSVTSSSASTAWIRFVESPWLYVLLGALLGAWLTLRALERRGKPRK
ncbi:hypothetical protein [Thermoflexus sp.]|uniref:hypothetical protein n=1 Tax=Thermoflexus sp. TaxID=1969742 RepID=UPI0035E43E4D